MIQKEQIEEIYTNDLQPKMEGMESLRKRIMWQRTLYTGLSVLAIGLFVSFYLGNYSGNWPIYAAILSVSVIGFLFLRSSMKYNEYRTQFKKEVVGKIVKCINPTYTYGADQHISESFYNRSHIFSHKTAPDSFSGNDLVTGLIGKTPFQFSEIESQEEEVYYNSNGDRKTKSVTIFKGIFFVAEFHKNLKQETIVVPEKENINILGKEKKKHPIFGDLVKLENPEFEKIFSVYSNNQNEARYILTPTMMEAMVSVYKNYNRKIYFSFIGENVYFSMPMSKDMFEPTIWKALKYKDIEEMFILFNLNAIIINEMDLNTRIWSKL